MDKIAGEVISYSIVLLPAIILLIAGLVGRWFSLKPASCHAPLWGRHGVAVFGLFLLVMASYIASAAVGALLLKGGSRVVVGEGNDGNEIAGTGLIVINLIAQGGALGAEIGFGLLLLCGLFPFLLIGTDRTSATLDRGTGVIPQAELAPPSLPLPLVQPTISPIWEQSEDAASFPLAVSSSFNPPHLLSAIGAVMPQASSGLPAVKLLSLRRWPWGVMLFALPAAWSMNVLTQLFLSAIGKETGQQHEMIKALHDEPSTLWLVALSAIILAPLTEEFLFRGLIQSFLRGWVGRWGAVLLASLIFMMVHPAFERPAIFVLGMLLGIIYERSGNLIAPMMVHATFNGITVLLTALMTQMPTTDPTTTTTITATALALLHAWPLFH